MSLKWNFYKLGELIDLSTGKLDSNAEEKNGSYPFFTCAPDPLKINSYSFNQKAILLAGNNANGNFHINYYEGKFDAYQRTYVIDVLDKERINLKFLYYALKICLNDFKRMSQGTSTRFLTKKILDNFEIQVPSLKTQLKIVCILDSITNKILNIQKINKNLEKQLYLIFDDIFIKCNLHDEESLIRTDWGKIPKNWKNIDFGDLIQITSGDRPDEKSEIKTSEFNIPLFGASKIMGYTKEFSHDEKILIIGRVGTHGIIQRVNYPCFPSDNTFVIKSDYYGFVYQLLKRIDYDSLNTGSTQPLITQKSLKTVNVVLPDEETLSMFEKISKVFFDKIDITQKEISNLTKLRDTLLPKLMSGEIDISKINSDLESVPMD